MNFKKLRKQMVIRQLESKGITDQKVLSAMNSIPRDRFVPIDIRNLSYSDGPLPIDCGQTISAPYVVAYMLEFLNLKPTDRVLEIGTGSGYNTALLANLSKIVYSLEINSHLAHDAKELLNELNIFNVVIENIDGSNGWREKGPFDAIILTASPFEISQVFFDQLKDGGRLIAPVGKDHQHLYLWTKKSGKVEKEHLIPVNFVPLTSS